MTADRGAGVGREHAVTRLALTRHGETVWHEENRYAGGSSDIDLTDDGVAQSKRLAEWASSQSFQALVSSPVRRAVETATPVAEATGLPMTVVEDLREVDFGVAEGRTAHELWGLDPGMLDRFRTDPVAHPFPGAEAPDSAADRAATALRSVAAAAAGGSALVVAHNTVLRLAMCRLLGLPVAQYRQLFPRLDNAAITELAVPFREDLPVSLLSLNVRLGPP